MNPNLGTLLDRIERGQADEVTRQSSLLAETSAWVERVRQFGESETQMSLTQAQWHSGMTESRKRELFREVFGEPIPEI